MSWEEMGTSSVPCPCGKGKITRTDFGDDWNRFREEIKIDCPACKAKYKLVCRSYYKHAGDSGEVYYLIEKGYPEYSGIRLHDVFPEDVGIDKLPFDIYLIKSYSLKDLQSAIAELRQKTAVSTLCGIAAEIAKQHKKAFKSARITVLRSYVQSACENYDLYLDNKNNRIPVEQQERAEREAYNIERRKHLIYIPL